MTVSPEAAPDQPVYVEIGFKSGIPVSVDGEELSPSALLGCLNDVAGANGIGRVDIVENRFVGMKSRGVYETPGGTILHVAHRALESITMDREVMRLQGFPDSEDIGTYLLRLLVFSRDGNADRRRPREPEGRKRHGKA